MTEQRAEYAAFPPVAEPDLKILYRWQKRLLQKALSMWQSKLPCALIIVFAADGCVSFFPAEAGGRECP